MRYHYHYLVILFVWNMLYSIITGCFQTRPLFPGNNITSIRWTSFAFHKVVRWYFLGVVDIHSHLCQISSGFCVPKIIKMAYFWLSWLSYSRHNRVAFWTTVYIPADCKCRYDQYQDNVVSQKRLEILEPNFVHRCRTWFILHHNLRAVLPPVKFTMASPAILNFMLKTISWERCNVVLMLDECRDRWLGHFRRLLYLTLTLANSYTSLWIIGVLILLSVRP